MTAQTQGAKANAHGEKNRKAIGALLLAHGFLELPSPFSRFPQDAPANFVVARQRDLRAPVRAFAADVVVGTSIHGDPLKAHYLIDVAGWPQPIALMSREQHQSGSADEKLEFLYANVSERFPCRAVVLLAGEAFGPTIIARGRTWVGRSKGRVAHVFAGLDEFRVWLTAGCDFPVEPPSGLF